MGVDQMFMENLEEFVNDENKIVTYKWLSTTLKVHVNQAKQMLYAFVQEQRNNKDNDQLHVTYFIAGLSHPVHGIKSLKCMVLPEENLEAFKSTLSLVTSNHIYSVSKSKIKDDGALYTADYDSIKENICDSNKYSAIKYPKAKVRSEAEIKSSQKQKKETLESTQLNGSTKQNGVNGHVSQKPADKPQKKAGIAGMFANQAKKTDNKSTEKSPEKDVKKEEPVKEDKKNDATSNKKSGMMAFFSKQTGKTNEKTAPAKKEEVVAKPEIVKKEPSTVKKEPSQSPPKRQSSAKGKGKRSKPGQDSDDDSQKKRRRIKAAIIDSSSEEEMDYESPVPSPVRVPSPAPESPVPEEVEKDSPKKELPEKISDDKSEKSRKRKRKLVPKTFMDEDGYMVTEKVWESESTDASDAEPPPKKQQQQTKQPSPQKKKSSPEKKSPPSAGSRKQAALTSFFKKK